MVLRPTPTDERVSQLCACGRSDLAAGVVLDAHGGEVMRFLVKRARDAQLASEAFSAFSEDLLRGLPGFVHACSIRTWVFTLAHHALARTQRVHARDRSRTAALSEAQERSGAVLHPRTNTPAYLRTEVKARMRELALQLPEDDQLLIDLRTTRRFAWKDIARIVIGSEHTPDDAEVEREAVRLRKRYQLATDRLRALAVAAGIVPPSDE